MIELFGLDVSLQFLVYLMLSFSFFIGIILLVSPNAFDALNTALQKEYGIKRRLAPKVEDSRIDFVDRILLKYRTLAGLLIALSAFALLILYKI